MRHGKLSSTLYIVTAGAHGTYKYVNRSEGYWRTGRLVRDLVRLGVLFSGTEI